MRLKPPFVIHPSSMVGVVVIGEARQFKMVGECVLTRQYGGGGESGESGGRCMLTHVGTVSAASAVHSCPIMGVGTWQPS